MLTASSVESVELRFGQALPSLEVALEGPVPLYGTWAGPVLLP